jgi:hypothetical protein
MLTFSEVGISVFEALRLRPAAVILHLVKC